MTPHIWTHQGVARSPEGFHWCLSRLLLSSQLHHLLFYVVLGWNTVLPEHMGQPKVDSSFDMGLEQ